MEIVRHGLKSHKKTHEYDKKKIIDICIPAPSLSHLSLTHPDISERNNALDLTGCWCHKFEAKIHDSQECHCFDLQQMLSEP